MKQRKTLQQQLAGRSPRSPSSPQAPLYGISPRYPGKLIQRLPDGSEVVGTFKNGVFVSSNR